MHEIPELGFEELKTGQYVRWGVDLLLLLGVESEHRLGYGLTVDVTSLMSISETGILWRVWVLDLTTQ